MCKKARWLEKFKKIYLLYSSPEQCAANSVQCLSIPKTQGQQITVVTLVYHAKAVYPVSAKSLQRPRKGCEEGSFCSIWGEGSLSSRGHVHVVLHLSREIRHFSKFRLRMSVNYVVLHMH